MAQKYMTIFLSTAALVTTLFISSQTMAQEIDPTQFDENSITINSLVSDIIADGATLTREHTIPGGVVALDSLERALRRSAESEAARAHALLRIAEMHLRLLGDANSAALISNAARISESAPETTVAGYMRGVAQDLREAGSVAAAQYLEENATLVAEGINPARDGLMDAAAISLRFGVTPQPGLAQMLGAEISSITPEYLRAASSDLLDHIANVTGDTNYSMMAERSRSITNDDVARIQSIIIEAKAERQAQTDQRFRRGETQAPVQSNPNSEVFR